MQIKQQYFIGLFFITVSVSIQAQSLSSSIKDGMKRELMKQIKPLSNTPTTAKQRSSSSGLKPVENDDLLEYYKKYKGGSGGAEFDNKYQVSPIVTTYTSKTPVNKLPDGYVVPIFQNGHFIFANPTSRVDGLVFPSGIDLSGGGKKKMSEKSKSILINVFGMEIDE